MKYHNSSNRNLEDAYTKTLKAQSMMEAMTIKEEMGRSTNKTVTDLNNKLVKLLDDLDRYEDHLKDDPERFTGFVKNMKEERARVERAKLQAMEMIKTLKKLEATITEFDMDF